MITLIENKNNLTAFGVVYSALCRSFSSSMITIKKGNEDINEQGIVVLVDIEGDLNLDLSGKKLIVFGALPENLAEKFDVKSVENFNYQDIKSREAESYTFANSSAQIKFLSRTEKEFDFDFSKSAQRFDFQGEWNNLDYGFIDHDDKSNWGLASQFLSAQDSQIATISDKFGNKLSYISLLEDESSSVLWVNRKVGIVDSHEWIIVENFVSDYRAGLLECSPALRDIPWAVDAAITMRLDCDEDVTSAQFLYEAYKSENVPLSLALHTSILESGEHDDFIHTFVDEGGALLSHTHTHAPRWGGSYDSAVFEAQTSKNIIFEKYNVNVEFAVTPFHHAPEYALRALHDTGYKGCVGGIVMNDPDFVYARGGNIIGIDSFVGHSQQVMLHGDCLLSQKDPLEIYKESFERSFRSQSFFGYLDHPFSDRYAYGWESEQQRANAHIELIEYIRSVAKNPLFTDQVNTLQFMYDKSHVVFKKNQAGYTGILPRLTNSQMLVPYFRYKGQDIKVEIEAI